MLENSFELSFRQMIHMKCHTSFSLNKMVSAAVMITYNYIKISIK